MIFENATRKEGGMHERVRLFQAVTPSWRKRALHERVTNESLAHEETCRGATQDALTLLQAEHRALLDDYRAALHELQRIGNGDEVDPTEIANQAIDAAEARMARFDTESLDAKLRVQREQLSLDIKIDTSDLRERLQIMEAQMGSIAAERRERDEGETPSVGGILREMPEGIEAWSEPAAGRLPQTWEEYAAKRADGWVLIRGVHAPVWRARCGVSDESLVLPDHVVLKIIEAEQGKAAPDA